MCDNDTSSVSNDSEVSHSLKSNNVMSHGWPVAMLCDNCGRNAKNNTKLKKHKAEENEKPVSLCDQCK